MDYKTLYEKLKKDNEKYIREEQKKVKIWFSQQAGKRAKMRALEKENEELKKENEELKEQIEGDNVWGINKGLKQEKSDLIKQYKRVVKENCKIQKENEKMKAFFNQLKVNVVKLEEVDESHEDEFACYFDGVKIESILP